MKNIIGIDHVNFTVNNFEETATWYKKVFGFEVVEKEINEDGKIWGVLRNGEAMLAISESPRLIDEGSSFHRIYHFGLRILDRDAWKRVLKKFNLQTYFNSPVNYPHSKSWYVRDPNNYTIEVSCWENNKIIF